MLTTSPSSQVKPQQWAKRRISVASSAASLPPPPAAGRLVTVVESRRTTKTVASAALGPVATEPAERSPVPQPPPLLSDDEETMLRNYVPVYVMLPRYGRPMRPLERSAPGMAIERLLEGTAPAPAPAFPFDPETDMTVGGWLAEAVDWVLDKIEWLLR